MTKKDQKKREPTVTPAELKLQKELEAVKATDKAQARAIRVELKRLAFLRLAPKRVRKALAALGNVEALGGYPVVTAEADKITGALRDAVDKIAASFAPSAKDASSDFEL